MTDVRTLKTIVRNMIELYKLGAFENLLTYRRKIEHSLCRADYEAVKQAFNHGVMS